MAFALFMKDGTNEIFFRENPVDEFARLLEDKLGPETRNMFLRLLDAKEFDFSSEQLYYDAKMDELAAENAELETRIDRRDVTILALRSDIETAGEYVRCARKILSILRDELVRRGNDPDGDLVEAVGKIDGWLDDAAEELE